MTKKNLLKTLELEKPSGNAAITAFLAEVADKYGIDASRLPADYVAFLQKHNGGSGDLGEDWIRLDGVDGILKGSAEYEFDQRGWLLIGGNGAGDGYGIDLRATPPEFFRASYIDQEPRYYGRTFAEFLQSAATGECPPRPGEEFRGPPQAGEAGEVARWKVRGGTAFVLFSPDGQRVLCNPGFKRPVELDLASGKPLKKYEEFAGPRGAVGGSCAAYSPDGGRLAVGLSVDKEPVFPCAVRHLIALFDTARGNLSVLLEDDMDRMIGVGFTPEGLVYSQTIDGTLRLWDAAAGNVVQRVPIIVDPGDQFTAPVNSPLAIAPDGRRMAVADTKSRSVALYEMPSGRNLATISSHTWGLCFSPDSRRLALGGTRREVTILDAQSLKTVNTCRHDSQPPQSMLDGVDFVGPVAFTPDGSRLVSCLSSEFCVWDAADGALLGRFPGQCGPLCTSCWGLCLSRDNAHAAVFDDQTKSVRIFRLCNS